MSFEGHCQDYGGTSESVGLIPTHDLPIVELAPIEGSEGYWKVLDCYRLIMIYRLLSRRKL